MRLLKKILLILLVVFLGIAALLALMLWLGYPKRPVDSVFTRRAAFTFDQIPKGRALTPGEIDGYARRLLAEMSLEEKVLQLSGDNYVWDYFPMIFGQSLPLWRSGVDRRLKLPPLQSSDGPRGVTLGPPSTCFPVAMARGASWDRALEHRIGEAIAREMRARDAGLWLAPCINLARHPQGGRTQESYGEDPFLLGEMAVSIVEGVQRHNVMACPKHFALNSIEETRQVVDTRVDERTLREVYLPHFQRVVEARPATIMTAYNKVNGDYASENRHLVREILKEEWGFDGFVISDWMTGVHDGTKAIQAGLDVEMPAVDVYGPKLVKAVKEGRVPVSLIDEAVLRILRTRIEYATRPDPQTYGAKLVHAPEHVALSREAAEKGIVLLKNEKLLPLDRAQLKTLAVIGPLADAEILGDHGSSRVKPPSFVSVLAGLKALAGPGVQIIYVSGIDPDQAKEAARRADAVVLVTGFTYKDEGEHIPMPVIPKDDWGGDRKHLALKPEDQELVKAVTSANPRTAVVLVGGGAITVEEWQAQAGAILMAFYPGEQGGSALARILFGEVNPSGRLPFTVPKDASQLPPFDNRSQVVEFGYYHGYTLAEKKGFEPRYAFGHGLSYTTFRFANLSLDSDRVKADGLIHASVEVTNTGSRAGEEVVQLYAGFSASKVDRPVKLLRGFEKVALAPGETKRVTLTLKAKDLAYYDPASKRWTVERVDHPIYIGGSSRMADLLKARVRIED